MPTLLLLYRRELKGFFLNLFGWVVLAVVACLQGFSLSTAMKAMQDRVVGEDLVFFVFHTPIFWFYFLFIFPLITMRLFAEEERNGTLETLLTAPVRTWQVVLAKYFAALTFFVILWIPQFIHLQLFTVLADIPAPFSTGSLLGAFLILFLMGAFFTAVGCFASSLTSSQIVAAIITLGLLLIHHLVGYVTTFWGDSFAAAPVLRYVSSQEHLRYFAKGLIDTRPVVYYLSMAVFVLILTHHAIDFRRWKR